MTVTDTSKMKKKIEKVLLVLVTAAVVVGVHYYTLLNTPASSTGEPVTIEVPRGTSFRVVANTLVESGVLKNAKGFNLAAKLSGAQKKIKAGEYELSPTMTPREVLAALVAGKTRQYSITIPEGYNIYDIALALTSKGFFSDADSIEFIKKARDRELARSFGVPGPTLEGYLFPDTYILARKVSPDELIARMTDRFNQVYDRGFENLQKTMGMTERQVVTLASIIEKETGEASEMPRISAVFHNRLRVGIQLQSDPTVIYGLLVGQGFDGNLTRKHLRTRTDYNTYRFYGLPPGPIANPGKSAIEAALNPEEAEYLYFVSRNDGTHKFSATLAEHNRAVRQYQKSGRGG